MMEVKKMRVGMMMMWIHEQMRFQPVHLVLSIEVKLNFEYHRIHVSNDEVDPEEKHQKMMMMMKGGKKLTQRGKRYQYLSTKTKEEKQNLK